MFCRHWSRLILAAAVFLGLCPPVLTRLAAQELPKPPVARQIPHLSDWHGEKVDDPFFWLREKENPETIRYLEAENAYTAAVTRPLQPFVDALYAEMLGHIKQTDSGAPTRLGNYFYYPRTEEGKQYVVWHRKRATSERSFDPAAPEEVVLDVNELAKGHEFCQIGAFSVSDDGNLLAYTVDTTGYRQFRLVVKNLVTGQTLRDTAERVTSVVWCADNRTLLYVTEDPVTKRFNLAWRHTLGEESEPVFFEKDRLFNLELSRSKDRRLAILLSRSTDTWESRILRSDQPEREFQVVLPRDKGHKYNVEHRDGVLYLRTNMDARNFRLVSAPVSDPSQARWKELVPHRADVLLEGFEVFQNHLVVAEKSAALRQFRVGDLQGKSWRPVAFPESVYEAAPSPTFESDSPSFRFIYQSLATPPTVYDCSLETGELVVRKRDEVPGCDPSQYVVERDWVTARDGVKVPLSIVYKKGARSAEAPLLLYAYGSYGAATAAAFSSNRLVLLDRGVNFVIAHIRGGNELGEAWHDDGMLLKKKNSFYDFIDCAQHLLAEKWTRPEKLVIQGGSAGGLLMGAVTNLRPDLFRAVHAAVPFMDVMNTMFDASLPLTVQEYLEWGNPNETESFHYMRSYSPYDNLERKAYPAILVTTSLNDSQVMYWEPAKYVAKLRTLKTDDRPLLLKCNMGAGHGGASGRFDRLKEIAFEYAWLLEQVGIRE